MKVNLVGHLSSFDRMEAPLCLQANRLNRYAVPRRFFMGVSRLGNGVAWYTLLVLLPVVYGIEYLEVSLHMTITALLGVGLYKWLKKHLSRERPFVSFRCISCFGKPLDRGSFPSGHTLHAVCFCTMLWQFAPQLLWLAVPFALCVAVSRVVLGHHYPSDVVAGAVVGLTLGLVSNALAGMGGI